MLPNVKSLFVRMKQEIDAKVNNIHCLEDRLFSHELGLAGTVDCIAEHNGVLSVIDFKTSVRLKKKENIGNYFMQAAAYRTMFKEIMKFGMIYPQCQVSLPFTLWKLNISFNIIPDENIWNTQRYEITVHGNNEKFKPAYV